MGNKSRGERNRDWEGGYEVTEPLKSMWGSGSERRKGRNQTTTWGKGFPGRERSTYKSQRGCLLFTLKEQGDLLRGTQVGADLVKPPNLWQDFAWPCVRQEANKGFWVGGRHIWLEIHQYPSHCCAEIILKRDKRES